MQSRWRQVVLVLYLCILSACLVGNPAAAPSDGALRPMPEETKPLTQITPTAAATLSPAEILLPRMMNGINMGNTLEVPAGEDWGYEIKPEYFDLIREQGFTLVRLPVAWAEHLDTEGKIESVFFARVDQVVLWAMQRDLVVILDMHSFSFNKSKSFDTDRSMFLSLWEQIAAHYQHHGDTLLFELLNEPDEQFNADDWNSLLLDTLRVVRSTNPRRFVLLGSVNWNAYDQIAALKLPEHDPYLMVTFHYYLPFEFTHQGADWVEDSARHLNTPWFEEEEAVEKIREDFDQVADWAAQQHVPVVLGEFGAYEKADYESRLRWTRIVREQAEAHNFAWVYWEFGAGFGVYDRQTAQWREGLLRSLIPEK